MAVLVTAGGAQAHPLGNFTVSHYNGLTLRPDAIDVLAVVDVAEIPTQQELPSIDTDGDDALSDAELAAHARSQCSTLVTQQTLTVDGAVTELAVRTASLVTVAGAAGLPTLRLTCDLSATADLSTPASIAYADDFRGDNVGWHELTAVGDGVRLVASAVPSASISDELRAYPEDLLSSPLDDRSVTLETAPGAGVSASGPGSVAAGQNPFSRALAWGDRKLGDYVGAVELTPWLGSLAMVLALLLGAGHALLPGHGKTVMAAYLAGRRGSRRDAYRVGGVVTLTHTASVLVLGFVISVSAAVLGEQALRWLGVVSGLIIAVVGALLLREAVRGRRSRRADPTSVGHDAHAHDDYAHAGHDHGHDHDHAGHARDTHTHDDHAHAGHARDTHTHDDLAHAGHAHADHAHDDQAHAGHAHADHAHDGHVDADHTPAGLAHDDHAHDGHVHEGAHVVAASQVATATAPSTRSRSGWLTHSHSHAESHTHGGDPPGGYSHGEVHQHGGDHPHGHHHGLSHSHAHGGAGGRTGLIGMGIAGGLVPSPSALIVLLGSIALGRTVFGVLLVLLYGVGMAGTLTAVGLVLVRVRGRLDRFGRSGRSGALAARVVAALPVVTAMLVLVVGIGLAVRGLIRPV